jgi:hypothetical protein
MNLARLHQRELAATDIFLAASVFEMPSSILDEDKLIGIVEMVVDVVMTDKRALLKLDISKGGIPPDPMD